MPTHDELIELVPAFVLGCLDPDDAVLVSSHISGCLSCQAEALVYNNVVDLLPLAVPELKPPPELKQRLMARIQSESAPGPTSQSVSAWQRFLDTFRGTAPAWGAVALLLIFGLALTNLFLWQQLARPPGELAPAGMHYVALVPSQGAPDASGVIVVSSDGEYGALVVENLPQLPAGHEYQLWLIDNGQRAPGPSFSVSDHGYQALEVEIEKPLDLYDSFSVTIEPTGGSQRPTGQTVLRGDF